MHFVNHVQADETGVSKGAEKNEGKQPNALSEERYTNYQFGGFKKEVRYRKVKMLHRIQAALDHRHVSVRKIVSIWESECREVQARSPQDCSVGQLGNIYESLYGV